VSMVDHVTLTAFDDPSTIPVETATWTFHYAATPIQRACPDITGNPSDDPSTPDLPTVQLLTAIDLPDGSSWGMETATSNPAGFCDVAGRITALRLPTLGRIEWTYQSYVFPTESDSRPYRQASRGVATRTVKNASGGIEGTWTYTTSLTPEPSGPSPSYRRELVNTVRTPLGDKEVHYFSVYPADPASADGWTAFDYALPFTRKQTDGTSPGRFLSTQIFDCDGAGNNCTLKRSVYVRYERDRIGNETGLLQDRQDYNRRQVSERTVYADDGNRVADVDSSSFDGLGHYRSTTTGGSFPSGNVRATSRNFNPNEGIYHIDPATNLPAPDHTFVMLPASSPWILGTATWEQVDEGGASQKVELCYEASTGSLLRKRTLTSGTTQSVTDLIETMSHDAAGNTIQEDFYGGDVQALGTGSLCSLALPAAQYRIDHTYQFGALASSQYVDGAGAPLSFKSLDQDIDSRTSLVRV